MLSLKTPYIFNIQKFSVHDGPGIRTTLFFKGCPLRCRWCHNPESQHYGQETMMTEDGRTEIVGKQYSMDELVKKVQADQIIYDRSGGGVTFSGGEVMTQNMEYVEELAKRCKQRGISVFIDTCGVAPTENFKKLHPYTDGFLYDLKFLNSQSHLELTGSSNELVLKNLQFLSDQGSAIYLRLILLGGLNDDLKTMGETIDWLKHHQIKIQKVELLPYHHFGRTKYGRLGRECTQNFEVPSEENIGKLKRLLAWSGYSQEGHSAL